MTSIVTIAQLTDVHLGPIRGFTPRYWSLKRATGYVNWTRSRRHALSGTVLARIVADVRAMAPDHVAVTGDLVNIGLPAEIEAATAWLAGLGPPELVSVIPGNHDIYARPGHTHAIEHWAAHALSCRLGREFHDHADAPFPYVRIVGRVALVGLNSAIPTPPFVAAGRLGEMQRARLSAMLERLGAAGFARLVMIHHPPLPGQASRSRGLADAEDLAGILARSGAELVVHGHNHRNMLAYTEGPGYRIPVVGTSTASHAGLRPHEPLARYALYRISHTPGSQRPVIEMIARGIDDPHGDVRELDRQRL